MHLVVRFGPPAVSKLTVGHEQCRLTGYRRCDNHFTIERSSGSSSSACHRSPGSSSVFRRPVLWEAIVSDLPGLVVTVEADADLDGFGDETQDACPQLASTQGPCPVLVELFAAASGRRVTVVVTTDSSATVALTGRAKVHGKQIALVGGTKPTSAGALTTFQVQLPKALRAALATLPPSRSMKVTLTASATDLSGRVTTDIIRDQDPRHPSLRARSTSGGTSARSRSTGVCS